MIIILRIRDVLNQVSILEEDIAQMVLILSRLFITQVLDATYVCSLLLWQRMKGTQQISHIDLTFLKLDLHLKRNRKDETIDETQLINFFCEVNIIGINIFKRQKLKIKSYPKYTEKFYIKDVSLSILTFNRSFIF